MIDLPLQGHVPEFGLWLAPKVTAILGLNSCFLPWARMGGATTWSPCHTAARCVFSGADSHGFFGPKTGTGWCPPV